MNLKLIRQKKGITQAEMADKLNVSRPTYIQIERGEKELTLSQAKVISELIQPAENSDVDNKFDFHSDKFKEVFLYILGKIGAKPNIGETALYKIFYFIDFDFYEKYGKSLTGATYMRNHHGPTPKQFKPVADEMIRTGEIERVSSKYFQYEQKKYLPHRSANLSLLNAIEKEHIDDILARLSDKNGTELREYSHEDVPWFATEDQDDISYDLVFQRTRTYAKTDIDALWSQASANDLLKELGPISDEEYEYYLNLPETK